ncbi:hypothetical protein HQ39_09305 [Porphyromonas sp. COT-108 OH2963]|nr:hypothetical protein HQ39_09305 [Porphyromonas sp. COT-108 OH2963]
MRLTCNIYTKAVCALTLLLVLLATGCRNEREDLPTGKRSRQLTLTASMPQDGGGMRVELKKSADNSTLIAKWKSGDMVTFVFEQGDVLTDPVEAAIGRIENNGKRAKLHIEVPESIDTSEEYTIHAFCGVPGTGVSVERGEILLDILPLRANRLEDIAVPVIAKRDISPEGEEEMALPFDYLGSIEYVDLKNGSSTTLRVNNCHLYAVDPAAEEWRYLPRNGKYHLYKPMTDEVMEADGDKPNPLEESGSAVSVAPGATHTFAVWHRPTGNSIPEFGISVQTDNGTQLSKNKKIAKAVASSDRQQHSGVRHIGADRQRDSALQEQEDSQSILHDSGQGVSCTGRVER